MSDRLRLVVVGAGIMGTNHARVARNVPGAILVGVIDADLERARAAARGADVEVAASIDELTTEFDAAVIALPTPFHRGAAEALAARGVHLLVEKPLAGNVDDAEAIISAAEDGGIILAVGHIERFNAAVAELPRLLDQPIHVEASRISPYSARIGDGVILDLMIHDIDIVCSLAGPEAEVVDISGVARSVRGSTEDIASITMRFSTGLTATFNTSRLGQQKIRTVEVTQHDSTIVADLVRQDITIHRMTRHEYLSDEGASYRQSSVVEIPFLETRGEPLALELAHFVQCVRTGSPPRVDGAAGLRALRLATAAVAAVHSV
ncbi:MAG: Gfo/Idh/MocA family oxidoreductase [Actinobacteria bacterium]|nr:Gfo/Idh/MocA family oxidoreductase [Actinomycetota bacterium]